jgi:tetratricopeptide (TPR) repeat protein
MVLPAEGETDCRSTLRRPKPNRAWRFFNDARDLAARGRFSEAIPLVERAIRLDQIAGFEEYHSLRAKLCALLGNNGPASAIDFYNEANRYRQAGRYSDAKVAFLEASALDSYFLWSANNYAWLLSTCKDPKVRNGGEAVRVAMEVCRESRWNCWAFIGTLAAACAAAGDFTRAVDWQSGAVSLVPDSHRVEAIIQLRHFQAGRAFIDEGSEPAVGTNEQNADKEDAGPIQDQAPLEEAKKQTNLLNTLVWQNTFRMLMRK